MKQNIAVIGAGFLGQNHIRIFHELGALHTICDINKDLKNGCHSSYSNLYFTESFSDVLSNSNINAVVISTPAIHHYQMAKWHCRPRSMCL